MKKMMGISRDTDSGFIGTGTGDGIHDGFGEGIDTYGGFGRERESI